MYLFRTSLGPADIAFTDRWGGVSTGTYAELNLALTGGDEEASIRANHAALLGDFAPGAALADLHQVHGDTVVRATAGAAADWQRPDADGVVTTDPDVVLMVRAADCVPVVLVDPAARVVGAAHAGRAGVQLGVVTATVRAMRELGAERVVGFIGPHVCGGCYEVPEQMRDEVAAVVPATTASTTWGTPSLDLGAGVRAQLEAADVLVHDVSECTRESERLYSHRRDGAGAGRQAGVVRLRPREAA